MDRLARYQIILSLPTISREQSQQVVSDLQEELEQRPHLAEPRVWWDAELARVLVSVTDSGPDVTSVGRMTQEEIFEAALAVLENYDVFRVDLVTVQPLDQ
jgi:hypothetical protein